MESAPLRYYVQPFSDKRNKFKLFGLNLLKSGFWDRNFKNLSLHSESTSWRCPPIFRQNGQTCVFEPKFAEKWILGSEFEKSKSKFRISILETLWAQILRQNKQLWIFRCKFAQKWFFRLKFQKSNSRFRISILEIICAPISSQQGQVWNFGHKFAPKAILGSEFQNC